MIHLDALKRSLLRDEATQRAYQAMTPEFELAGELIAARVRAGLTQAQVAERMHTSPSTVARMESGRSLPSLRSLGLFAAATGTRAVVRLEAPHEAPQKKSASSSDPA